jgi:hypothetical protein
MTRKFLDENFMYNFIATAEKGVIHSHRKAMAQKKACLPDLEAALKYFSTAKLDEKTSYGYVKSLSAKVGKGIDRLAVKKDSVEYVFASALATAVKEYFEGVKKNPVEEKRYLKNKAKYDAIISKGRKPDWTLTPQVIVDLDLKRSNICKVIENLYNHYNAKIVDDTRFNANAHVIEIVDFFKD